MTPMPRLRYHDDARRDLRQLIAYGVAQGLASPTAFVQGLREEIGKLRDNPSRGRPGRLQGTREFVIAGTQRIAVYTVEKTTITVLRVLHGAMQ